MDVLSFFKKIIFSSSNKKEENGRDDIELANILVEQEHLSMNLELPLTFNDEDGVSKCEPDTKSHIEESEDCIETIKDSEDLDRQFVQQGTGDTIITALQAQKKDTTDESGSLLDNSNYMSLVESLTSLMQEIEDIRDLPSQEVVDLVKCRILEGLLLSGAELIAEDEVFDVIRHQPIPAAMIKKGELIDGIVEPGILVENKVIKKAKVRIKKG